MAFQPAEMTEATLRRLVDNLVRHTKSNPIPEAPKRSQLQEAVAATLGWPSYHAAITTLKNKTASQESGPETRAPDRPWVFPLAFPAGKGHCSNTVLLPCDWDPSGTLDKASEGKERDVYTEKALQMQAHVDPGRVASTIVMRAGEQTRSLAFEQILRLNPDRPLCVIQGPISLVKPIESASRVRGAGIGEILAQAEPESIFRALSSGRLEDRAGVYFQALIDALVVLRDKHKEPLDKERIRAAISFGETERMARDQRIPQSVRQELFSYLQGLSHYRPAEEIIQQDQPPKINHSSAEVAIHRCLNESLSHGDRGGIFLADGSSHLLQVTLPQGILSPSEVRLVQNTVGRWADQNQGGLIFIDAPPKEQSDLWHWIFNSHTHWSAQGRGVWIGIYSNRDLPDDLFDRILLRADHHLGRHQ